MNMSIQDFALIANAWVLCSVISVSSVSNVSNFDKEHYHVLTTKQQRLISENSKVQSS